MAKREKKLKKVVVNLRVTQDLHLRMKEVSDTTGFPFSALMRLSIEVCMDNIQRHLEEGLSPLEALAKFDKLRDEA